MKRKKYLHAVISVIILLFPVSISYAENNTEGSLSDSMFTEKDNPERYGCIRFKRGDIIELDGRISSVFEDGNTLYILTTPENRKFMLQADTPDGQILYGNGIIHLKGVILFEGSAERLPVLKLISH